MSDYSRGEKGPRYAALIDTALSVPFEQNTQLIRSRHYFIAVTHNAVERSGVNKADALDRIMFKSSMSILAHEDKDCQYITVNDRKVVWLIKATKERDTHGTKFLALVVTAQKVEDE